MATTLRSIVDCELLNLIQVYEGICFGHVLFKACNILQMMTKFLWG
jgi:hypothetical protein